MKNNVYKLFSEEKENYDDITDLVYDSYNDIDIDNINFLFFDFH